MFLDGKEISKKESILKVEQVKKGCERILIVKNVKNNDSAKYTVKSLRAHQTPSKGEKRCKKRVYRLIMPRFIIIAINLVIKT